MAVAEAVKNALDSLEDAATPGGEVEIEIVRNAGLFAGEIAPIEQIIIRDNGSGFTDLNFDSFCTPDSDYKLARGGKGLGRLICLQAFEHLEVESDFKNGSGWERRNIKLQCEAPEVSEARGKPTEDKRKTEIRLNRLRKEYQTAATMKFESLADWLIEHFLPSLVEKPLWLNSIVIREGKKAEDLTGIVKSIALWDDSFELGKYPFRIACYPVSGSGLNGKNDQVRLVAVGRVVYANTRDIEHYVPHLKSIEDDQSHVILVYSQYFDEHVNDARNGVSLGEERDETALLGFTSAQFHEAVANSIKLKAADRLSACDAALREKIETIVKKEAQSYRPLLPGFFRGPEFASLALSARTDGVLGSLDAYKRRQTAHLKKESKRLSRLAVESAGYAEAAKKLAEELEEQQKVALAEYVSLRKIVLDRLQALLDADANGIISKESAIHNLIFPQRTNIESRPLINHQLWILDERLEANTYLASDEPMDGKNGDRPDLLIALDHPGAFASDPSPKANGYDRIALVEFKRPLLDFATCPTDDLPHRQMMRYAKSIEDNKAVHMSSKRPIKVAQDVRYYMYAVCEMSPKFIERLVRDEGLIPSPTDNGAFGVKNDGRYYIEYIDLLKLLEDARTRNAAFFRQLGLE